MIIVEVDSNKLYTPPAPRPATLAVRNVEILNTSEPTELPPLNSSEIMSTSFSASNVISEIAEMQEQEDVETKAEIILPVPTPKQPRSIARWVKRDAPYEIVLNNTEAVVVCMSLTGSSGYGNITLGIYFESFALYFIY